jgi:hypothetical protein
LAGIQARKNLLRAHPQFGQITQSVEAENLLAHAVILDESVAVAI